MSFICLLQILNVRSSLVNEVWYILRNRVRIVSRGKKKGKKIPFRSFTNLHISNVLRVDKILMNLIRHSCLLQILNVRAFNESWILRNRVKVCFTRKKKRKKKRKNIKCCKSIKIEISLVTWLSLVKKNFSSFFIFFVFFFVRLHKRESSKCQKLLYYLWHW